MLFLGTATLLTAQTTKPKTKAPVQAAQLRKAGHATSAHLRVVPVRYTGACPGKFKFLGSITTNGPAEVKYTWASFDGGTWPEHTLTFTAAGTKNVTESRQMGTPGQTQSGWMQLKVVAPNTLHSTQARFQVACGVNPRGRKK